MLHTRCAISHLHSAFNFNASFLRDSSYYCIFAVLSHWRFFIRLKFQTNIKNSLSVEVACAFAWLFDKHHSYFSMHRSE